MGGVITEVAAGRSPCAAGGELVTFVSSTHTGCPPSKLEGAVL